MANSSAWNETVNLTTIQKAACVPFSSASSTAEIVMMIVGYTIQFILSLVGNALVIAVFYKHFHKLRAPVHYFIVNMAVSDLLVPFFVIPRRVQEIFLGWGPWLVDGVMGDILCKVVNFADEISVTVSSQSMVFIAVERFWAIVYPLKYPLISRKTTPRFIAFTWIFSALFYSYYFFAYKLVVHKDKTLHCEYGIPDLFETWDELWKVDRVSLFAVFGVLPFLLLTVLYTAIIVALYRQKAVGVQTSSTAQKRRTKEKQKITLMLLTVVIIFFIAWTPHYVFVFDHYFSHGMKLSCRTRRTLYVIVKFINYSYTVLNPLIYYMFNKTYRQGFYGLLTCRKSYSGPVFGTSVGPRSQGSQLQPARVSRAVTLLSFHQNLSGL